MIVRRVCRSIMVVIVQNQTPIYKGFTERYEMNLFQGNTLSQGVFGDKEANNAGEYLSVDRQTGDVMIYVDSDSVGGDFAFMKLSKH